MFQIDIIMKLRKIDHLDQDPRQEENLTCLSVEPAALWEFFGIDDKQRYKFLILDDAHFTTQAMLYNMYQDLNMKDNNEA